jgi:hypothetical protein
LIFRTEFTIDRVSGNDEGAYLGKLYEIVNSIIAKENIVRLPISINYNAKTGRNLVSFSWKSVAGVYTENPKGIFNTGFTPEEINNALHIRAVHKALREVKWLKKKGIADIATMHC